jgi:hypothetical protein
LTIREKPCKEIHWGLRLGVLMKLTIFVVVFQLQGGTPAHTQGNDELRINRLWALEFPSALNQMKCSIWSFQSQKRINVTANYDRPYTYPYLLTFFANGNVGPEPRTDLVFKFDQQEQQIDTRAESLSGGKFIGGVEMSRSFPSGFLSNLESSIRLEIFGPSGVIGARFSLEGSREAIRILDECRMQLMR